MLVIPISASSKIIQLRTILTNKSAGQVSRPGWIIASYNNFGTNIKSSFSFSINICLARIITYLVETRDISMVLNLFISLILNISIVIACTVYKYGTVQKSKDKKKKKTT
jgi:hypothetical protein